MAEETPEQEAKRIEKEAKLAAARGDISTLLNLMVSTSSMTATDFIKKTCGSLLFMYYSYVENLHTKPMDIEDMIDGILYLEARNYMQQQRINDLKAQKK